MNKIKEEQLSKIQEQQRTLNEILNEVGYLEAQKHGLLHQFAGVNKEVEDLKSELESEYGAVVMSNIRKISIGSDYKNEAMHYSVGQQVYGGHEISNILFNDTDNSYNIFITKQNEVLPWKKFNSNMAIAVEFDLEY